MSEKSTNIHITMAKNKKIIMKKNENENKNEKKTTVTNHESLLVDGILENRG